MEKASAPAAKLSTVPPVPGGTSAPIIGRFFRNMDWFTGALVFLVVFAGYLLTLSPDLTLEDSGELAVASKYAGVPHPPGYPIWTVYTWLFTKIIPFSNIAFRVSIASSFAAAMAAGFTALLISRGSSLILEGIPSFATLEKKTENTITFVAGLVGGLLLGFNGYVWSQAVIVEVYTVALVNLTAVLFFLAKWVYAPHQRRYLYLATFLFGMCLCNHQTLVVAAMGFEVCVAAADRKVGRDLFILNTAVWLLGLIAHFKGSIVVFQQNTPLFIIFNIIGLGSFVAAMLLSILEKGALTRIHVVIFCIIAWCMGAAFYLYMPVAGASNPPMNWGYPRTWEGFIHAFTRGQYEKTSPSLDPITLSRQLMMYASGVQEEFSWANMLIAFVPLAFFRKMRAKEQQWIVGMAAIYLCLAVLLTSLLNPSLDISGKKLVKVFFTSSHVFIAMASGYGIALIGALLVKRYKETRLYLLIGAAVVCAFNLYQFAATWTSTELFLSRAADLVSLLLSVIFVLAIWISTSRGPLTVALCLFSLMPLDTIMSHWTDNEQSRHYFGFWFGHDMFEPGVDTSAAPAPKDKTGKPFYQPMARDAVLFGGTDPGRFCPTYMIFDESFIEPADRRDPKFDRRDVYLITQNALADNTYLDYIRAHYNRSAQYQYDKPFFYGMLNDEMSIRLGQTNGLATLFSPIDRWVTTLGDNIEKERRAGSSYFHDKDFLDFAKLSGQINGAQDPLSAYLKTKLDRFLVNGEMLAQGLNLVIEGPSLFDDPKRFATAKLTPHTQAFAVQNPPTHNRIRLNRLLLEEYYPGLIAKSEGGLYPDREILTPTLEDASRCFSEYVSDAARRYQLQQIRPGEIVVPTPDGRYSVSGQVAVMSINGLLTKVIFDKNPSHEFYVEESFPLDWMYPHLTPYGIIMKIEREPVAELSEEMVRRDHEFWSQYSERFIGNWITYDTPIKDVCEFAERVFLHRESAAMAKYHCDPRFIRDDSAQKSFSKLRNAIGKSIYSWRINTTASQAGQARMIKEAEFSLKQAFAFCPLSPESVYNLAQLLAGLGRIEDAILVAETCEKFDANNLGVADLVQRLKAIKPSLPVTDIERQIDSGHIDMNVIVDGISTLMHNYQTNKI
ncbi:MAG TPA: DUF2723 domain-containing protein, partial [Candidatus Limnocylindria bacterium]|nr:DUF2723 domain-containing protein [Candidatus Limnocylindria bacterium]